ncbi:MAG: hypothetical protein OXU26_01545 [Acidobacteriota bacterium]|nr:hypothetical protein [Acidobacteriota bacterium]
MAVWVTLLVLVGLIFLVSMLIGKVAAKLTGRAQRSKAWGWRIFCFWISLHLYITGQRALMLGESTDMMFFALAMVLGSAFFVYWVYFRWERSRTVGPADFVKHRIPIIVSLLVFPALTLGLAIWMYPLLSLDQASGNYMAMGMWIIFVLNVLGAVPVGWGFAFRKRWAKKVARVVSFWYAAISIPGFCLALYTWWATQAKGNLEESEP